MAGQDAKKEYVHMLNCTLTATERTLCCILENYQTPDGVRYAPVAFSAHSCQTCQSKSLLVASPQAGSVISYQIKPNCKLFHFEAVDFTPRLLHAGTRLPFTASRERNFPPNHTPDFSISKP
jgi:hypothetical protein